ncbi:hypothetical protein AAMO2058_000278600 [Amorphochlora amoebiformis]
MADTAVSKAPTPGRKARGGGRRPRGRGDTRAKLKIKIKNAIEGENYYLAEQLIISQFNRSKSKDLEGSLETLVEGASDLLKAKQGNEGGSLAKAYIQELVDNKILPDTKKIVRIQSLFAKFTKEHEKPRLEFMKEAIQWTSKLGECPHGDARLHTDLARYYHGKNSYGLAHRHYVRGRRPTDHARLVLEWAKKGYPSERDLFIARAVLEYLCVENLKNANEFFAAVTKTIDAETPKESEKKTSSGITTDQDRPSVDTGYTIRTPLLNFLSFLLKTVERDALPLFDMLCAKYRPSLLRDSKFKTYLQRIAQIYFGRQAPKGMLEELMSMFST